jgi:hypothetical protein
VPFRTPRVSSLVWRWRSDPTPRSDLRSFVWRWLVVAGSDPRRPSLGPDSFTPLARVSSLRFGAFRSRARPARPKEWAVAFTRTEGTGTPSLASRVTPSLAARFSYRSLARSRESPEGPIARDSSEGVGFARTFLAHSFVGGWWLGPIERVRRSGHPLISRVPSLARSSARTFH